jgi:hypothetical protein
MTSKETHSLESLNQSLVRDMIESDVRKDEFSKLLETDLPSVATLLENQYAQNNLRLTYDPIVKNNSPMIEVIVKANTNTHTLLILLDSKTATFVIGSERGGQIASTSQSASSILFNKIDDVVKWW